VTRIYINEELKKFHNHFALNFLANLMLQIFEIGVINYLSLQIGLECL